MGEAARLINRVDAAGHFIQDAGETEWLYLPLTYQGTGLSPANLRALADELERRNAASNIDDDDWDDYA